MEFEIALPGGLMLRDPEGVESKIILDLAGSPAGRVLEIGCGDGRLTGALTRCSDYVLGLDNDHLSIDRAKWLHGDRAGLILGSGQNIPFLADSFDLVFFSFSLHHQDPVRAFKEARRVLKEDGRILVLEPVEHSLVTMLFALLDDESGRYQRAEIAINTCGLKELRSGSFRSTWVFDDFQELAGYLFDHFCLEPDKLKIEGFKNLLGKRETLKPLELEDITRYWLLHEDSSQM